MSGERLERARMLLGVGRRDEALRELTAALADTPDHAGAHALMAVTLAGLERFQEATESAQRAVGLAPDSAYAHYVLGSVLCDRDRDKEALLSAREALRLDPEDADYCALEAACLAGLRRWKDMLAAAERGLALDPGHVRCLNLRASALRQLGQADEAAEALEYALAEDPDEPDTHATYGFASLQRGKVHEALTHFREALRLDPSHSVARAGLVEALKAKNPLYRPILWWMLFTSRLSGGRGLLLLFGVMYGVRYLSRALSDVPGLEVVAGLLVFVYVLAVWTSWVGSPLFDLLLLLRRDTRDVLEERDRFVAMAVGGTLVGGVVSAVLLYSLGEPANAVIAAFAYLAVAIPVAGGLSLPNKKARFVGAAIALTAVVAATAGVLFSALDAVRGDTQATTGGERQPPLGLLLLLFALGGAPLSSWLLLGLSFVKARR